MKLYLSILISNILEDKPDIITYAYIYTIIDILAEETESFKKDVKKMLEEEQKNNFDLEVEYTNRNLEDIGVADLLDKPIQVNYDKYKSKKLDSLIDSQFGKYNKEIKSQLLNMINTQDTSGVENLIKTYLKKEKTSSSIISKMMRIYRTESTQMRTRFKLDLEEELKNQGIEVNKRWVHTLRVATNVISDNYTPREDHLMMDGQVADSNGYFYSPNGYTTKGPGMFGFPEEDTNCRCDIEFTL